MRCCRAFSLALCLCLVSRIPAAPPPADAPAGAADGAGGTPAGYGALPDPNPQKIKKLDPKDREMVMTARWYIGEENKSLGRSSSSELGLLSVLHALKEKDVVSIQEDAGAYVYQYQDKGETFSVVLFTEQKVKSDLYSLVEVPLWEVRNATIYKSTTMSDYFSVVKEHVPPRREVKIGDPAVKRLKPVVLDYMNEDAGYERFGEMHVFAAEKQELDVDFKDLFYEKQAEGEEVMVRLTYLFFGVADAEKPAQQHFIASVYSSPDYQHRVVRLMDVKNRKDVDDFASSGGAPSLPGLGALSRLWGGSGRHDGGAGASRESTLTALCAALGTGFACMALLLCVRARREGFGMREGIQLLRRKQEYMQVAREEA
jgi:hypothetical protein